MTCNASQERLDYVFGKYGYNHPLRKDRTFDFRIVYSQEADVHRFRDVTHLKTPCKDIAKTNDGLLCRVDYAQTHFPKHIAWHYRAMDDTFLHLDNLLTLIDILEKIYNPYTDVVFRAFPNWHFSPHPFIGGGAGWLMSNAFVTHIGKEFPSLLDLSEEAPHHQDDTSLYTLISCIFDSTEQWADNHFIDQVLENSYSQNLRCSSQKQPPYKRLNEAVSLHVAPRSYVAAKFHPPSNNGREASTKMLGNHPELRYLMTHAKGSTTVCISDPDDPSEPLSLAYENRSYKLVRPQDFANHDRSWWKHKPYNRETHFKNDI